MRFLRVLLTATLWLIEGVLLIFAGIFPSNTSRLLHADAWRTPRHWWQCERCGYDLRGAAPSPCPECSTPVPEGIQARLSTMREEAR